MSVFKQSVSFTKYTSFFNTLIYNSKRFAGHSHWQNVRHVKEANDRLKSKTAQYYSNNGERNPKLNTELASVLAEAKANNVPQSTLDKFLKSQNTERSLVELKAQGGLFILLEVNTASIASAKQRIHGYSKKFGCTYPTISGSIIQYFDHIGVVFVSGGLKTPLPDLNTATNVGIEVGALEVEESVNNGEIEFQFYCDPIDIGKLSDCLRNEHNLAVLETEDVYKPKSFVNVTKEVHNNLQEMYERLRLNFDYIERIFDNVKIQTV